MELTGLKVIDACDLDQDLRKLLRPGEMVRDRAGRRHRLPRYFYEIPSYEEAAQVQLTPHFRLNEFIRVDVKEDPRIQEYPRQIPCAVRILAFYLEQFRMAAGASVHISVNGGYRSPAHKRGAEASPHMWATGADIYRIGSTILDSHDDIAKYNKLALEVSDDWIALEYGHEQGTVDDHIHLDLGFLVLTPREISEDRMELPQESPRFAFEERRRGDRRAAEAGPSFSA